MCCGNQRTQVSQTTQTHPESDSLVYFQYIGTKGLTVMGPTSRKRYRFDISGAVVAIDSRDMHALAHVPLLRQVSKVTDVPKEF
jgi:hypothetical protein